MGAIVNDLSPALVQDVSYFLINDQVRCSILFHDLPNSALAHLMPILEQTTCEASERIVTYGDPGINMYVIIDGKACFEQGHQWKARDPLEVEDELKAQQRECKQTLTKGDSFGEEIVLGLEEEYHYTIIASTAMSLYSICESKFLQAFHHLPDVMHKMLPILCRTVAQMSIARNLCMGAPL